MRGTKQKRNDPVPLIDLAERNLPREESEDNVESLSTPEFLLWMLGIAFLFLLVSIVYHILS